MISADRTIIWDALRNYSPEQDDHKFQIKTAIFFNLMEDKGEIKMLRIMSILSAIIILLIINGIGGEQDLDKTKFENISSSKTQSIYIISGEANGEILLTLSIRTEIPVSSGNFGIDLVGTKIPPFALCQEHNKMNCFANYTLPDISIPASNNMKVIAEGVNNLNLELKEQFEEGKNLSRSPNSNGTRAGIDGKATIDSLVLHPGIYNATIFGEPANNKNPVKLTLVLTKKMAVNGPFSLALDITGFPGGDHSISVDALNGSLKIDEMNMVELPS